VEGGGGAGKGSGSALLWVEEVGKKDSARALAQRFTREHDQV
jgi:hypothetical protein